MKRAGSGEHRERCERLTPIRERRREGLDRGEGPSEDYDGPINKDAGGKTLFEVEGALDQAASLFYARRI